jgi:hypothetical protein
MQELMYDFEPLGGSSWEDYNDPLKTIFGRDSRDNLAREAIQNSIDANVDPDKPVRVVFKLEKWKKRQIPDVSQLEEILKACEQNEKSKKHFQNTNKILKSDDIPVLIISDFNTTGLSGTDDKKDRGSNFYNFFKAVGGVGDSKLKKGGGGCYGYGKAANVAASAFDTFFATSVFKDNDKFKVVFMGSLRLVSHEIEGIEKRAIGSYGFPGQRPVREKTKIPKEFLRRTDETGTDIFILGMKNYESWKEDILFSVLKNFWLAIAEKKLEVTIGEKRIYAGNMESECKKFFESTKIEFKDHENPVPYILAYKEKPDHIKLETLGPIRLYVRVDKDSKNTTGHFACFRKNLMLIQTKRFSSITPFTGLFVCDNQKGNDILRMMEPPNHKEWSTEELHAKDELGETLPECKSADREFKKCIKEKIQQINAALPKTTLTIENLDDFITLDETAGEEGIERNDPSAADKELESADLIEKSIKILGASKKQKKKQKSVAGTNEEPGNVPVIPDLPRTEIPIDPTSVNTVPGSTGTGDASARLLHCESRYICEENNGQKSHILILRSKPSVKVAIEIFQSGDDEDFPVRIKPGKGPYTISSNGLIQGLKTDSNGKLQLTFESELSDPTASQALKVRVYEV